MFMRFVVTLFQTDSNWKSIALFISPIYQTDRGSCSKWVLYWFTPHKRVELMYRNTRLEKLRGVWMGQKQINIIHVSGHSEWAKFFQAVLEWYSFSRGVGGLENRYFLYRSRCEYNWCANFYFDLWFILQSFIYFAWR